jgi:hypothetical protein
VEDVRLSMLVKVLFWFGVLDAVGWGVGPPVERDGKSERLGLVLRVLLRLHIGIGLLVGTRGHLLGGLQGLPRAEVGTIRAIPLQRLMRSQSIGGGPLCGCLGVPGIPVPSNVLYMSMVFLLCPVLFVVCCEVFSVRGLQWF